MKDSEEERETFLMILNFLMVNLIFEPLRHEGREEERETFLMILNFFMVNLNILNH